MSLARTIRALAAGLLLSLALAASARADVILLKNGGRLEGVIKKETKTTIVLKVGGGTLKIKRKEIRKILRRSDEANEKLKEKQKAKDKKGPAAPPPKTPETERARRTLDQQGRIEDKAEAVNDGPRRFSLRLPAGWETAKPPNEAILLAARRPKGAYGDLIVGVVDSGGRGLGAMDGAFRDLLKGSYPKFEITKTKNSNGAPVYIGEYKDGAKTFIVHAAFFNSGYRFKYMAIFRAEKDAYKKLERSLSASLKTFTPVLP